MRKRVDKTFLQLTTHQKKAYESAFPSPSGWERCSTANNQKTACGAAATPERLEKVFPSAVIPPESSKNGGRVFTLAVSTHQGPCPVGPLWAPGIGNLLLQLLN